MTNEEAMQVAEMIGTLWPNTPMGGERLAFYAKGLVGIPTVESALQAVRRLSMDEVHQPPSGRVVDAAIDTDTLALDAWTDIVRVCRARQAQRPSGVQLSRCALRAMAGAGIDWLLPIDNDYLVNQARQRFMLAFRETRRSEVMTPVGPELAPGPASRPIEAPSAYSPIDTTAAVRRLA